MGILVGVWRRTASVNWRISGALAGGQRPVAPRRFRASSTLFGFFRLVGSPVLERARAEQGTLCVSASLRIEHDQPGQQGRGSLRDSYFIAIYVF